MMGDAPIKVQQDRKKLMEGHFNISITKRVSLENSTDLGRGAAPELKSVEFLSETLLVVEQIDIHTNFTARQMLYLYRSITHIYSATSKVERKFSLEFSAPSRPADGRPDSLHPHGAARWCRQPYSGAVSPRVSAEKAGSLSSG